MSTNTLTPPDKTAAHAPRKKKEKHPYFFPAGEYWTDEEIIALPTDQGQRYELWDGSLIIMSHTGAQHGESEMRLATAMFNFAEAHELGLVYGGDAGFRLTPLKCYAPDVSYVSRERLRSIRVNPKKFLREAPDLAVEILSPNDSRTMIAAKIADYFDHGTLLAWVIDPNRRQAIVYRAAQEFITLEGDAYLDGADVLPGFSYSLVKLLKDPAFL